MSKGKQTKGGSGGRSGRDRSDKAVVGREPGGGAVSAAEKGDEVVDQGEEEGGNEFQTVGYTKRYQNTSELEETNELRETLGGVESAFWTALPPTIESSATADIWHWRMGHIGPLGLYELGREYLGVRLKGKTTASCPDCALSKITQQISRYPLLN